MIPPDAVSVSHPVYFTLSRTGFLPPCSGALFMDIKSHDTHLKKQHYECKKPCQITLHENVLSFFFLYNNELITITF
ncbi:hypothetical protein KHU1_3110 [Bacillus amyloliquefaciens KHG19]|nr:hypothetical protein KHU1_3110 [Bacillus amyloliquefaciens KHG19]RAP13433.1 hypothetical protein HS9_02424 [Bacillus velezensis]